MPLHIASQLHHVSLSGLHPLVPQTLASRNLPPYLVYKAIRGDSDLQFYRMVRLAVHGREFEWWFPHARSEDTYANRWATWLRT
jgi:hypothetical protein